MNIEGSGIGLSLVKSFVDMHGGKITIESTYGEGSTFIVKLPIIIKDEKGEKAREPFDPSYINKMNIEFSDIYK